MTIILGDCRQITNLADVACMITDPPYSRHVHECATSQSKGGGARKRKLGFDHLSSPLRDYVANAAASVRRWSVIFSDVESSQDLVRASSAKYIRTMPWVRWSMPQLSGDRPAQGFEHIVLFWGLDLGKKSWNGSGSVTHLAHLAMRGDSKHKTEKPLDLCLDLVSWFSNPGELVYDPFAGSGAIGRACQLLDRQYLGVEIDPVWHARAQRRLAGPITAAEQIRIDRWLMQPNQASKPSGRAAERGARRDADKSLLRPHRVLGACL